MIRAEAHPDDHAIEVYFDATPWFEQARDEDILKLSRCDAMHTPEKWQGSDVEVWGQDYPADEVAQWMATDGEIAQMFRYIEIRNNLVTGFECYVHAGDAQRWIAEHRPHLMEAIGLERGE